MKALLISTEVSDPCIVATIQLPSTQSFSIGWAWGLGRLEPLLCRGYHKRHAECKRQVPRYSSIKIPFIPYQAFIAGLGVGREIGSTTIGGCTAVPGYIVCMLSLYNTDFLPRTALLWSSTG